MVLTAATVLLFVALLLFIAATFNMGSPLDLTAAGLVFLTLYLLFGRSL